MASFIGHLGQGLANTTADLLSNSNFINRSIGMSNSYEDIMFIVQALGREPISLLGKNYLYIFDHVRRNYNMGSNVMNPYHNECPKFTFYKERPTVRFADPYNDSMNLLDKWVPDVDFESTSQRNILFSYAESDDDYTNNKEISVSYDIDNANPGVNFGGISSFLNTLNTCDMVKKTNDNFNHGKYKTLIARFHTNSMDSKSKDDITQTAISDQFGMSHGRNLLRRYSRGHKDNGYDNPYCRVWTYHHQYNQLSRAIRPFDLQSAKMLENGERSGNYDTVGFRTVESKDFGFKGGSERLDKYGVLNYRNGLVNIAPTAKIKDYFEGKQDKEVTIKRCMFSIENLAWKSENVKMDEYDQYGLSPEQKGPLGGRIMWFPPYDLSFNESVRVNWNPNQFIGRGEKVYTYTDTERGGNLSFTLLIDHPSILDYWTGHKRNGMKNQRKSLIPGNGGGIDEVDNQENTLLRFFAGCEVLTAKPQEFRQRELKKETAEGDVDNIMMNPPGTEEHGQEGKKTIHCVLYYPNNYSGVDDSPNDDTSIVNAIYYLMNGVGAQKYVDNNLDASDIPLTSIDNKVSATGFDGIGGYEISTGLHGISLAIANLNEDPEQIKSTYVDLESPKKKAQRLTGPAGATSSETSSGTGFIVKYGNDEYELAKIIGSEALPLNQAYGNNLSGATHKWYRKRWYYRIDKVYENQEFSNKDSYLDKQSFGLNSKDGYKNVESIKDAFGLTEQNSTLISFADMFVALEGEKAEKLLEGHFDKNNVGIIRELKDSNSGIKILKIEFNGHASFQGRTELNSTLSRNRAITFKKWMSKNNFPNIADATIGIKEASPNKNNENIGYNSDKTVKLWRSASVTIEYEKVNIEDASLANSSVADESKGNSMNKIDKVSIENGKIGNPALNATINFLNKTSEGNLINAKYATTVNKDLAVQYGVDPWTMTMQDMNRLADSKSWDYDQSFDSLLGGESNVESIGVVERYDNEGEFFELLEKNDPFMHHLITEKIRYFDPAYHSISPEGFNARLTFLHQCTRQGSTVGGSDSQIGNTAYNLAFGRPPVCVLRLGDFYNTKIIINSINIQYDQPQWDLNPEGIGVMPMFAKITLDFVFLGGSDLAGPISRLQNAVSFNYYANTSVYDNRAEMVQYDSDGSGHEVKFKPFSYPDMMHNDGMPKKKETVKKGTKIDNKRVSKSDQNVEKATYELDIKEINSIGVGRKIEKKQQDYKPQSTITRILR